MYALPPRIGRERLEVSGVVCPDCGGVIRVRAEGRDAFLVFECRVGHTYDVSEFLGAKEELLEGKLCAVMTAFEEFAVLLHDLADRGGDHGKQPEAVRNYCEREAVARQQALRLRELLRANRPVDLTRSEPR